MEATSIHSKRSSTVMKVARTAVLIGLAATIVHLITTVLISKLDSNQQMIAVLSSTGIQEIYCNAAQSVLFYLVGISIFSAACFRLKDKISVQQVALFTTVYVVSYSSMSFLALSEIRSGTGRLLTEIACQQLVYAAAMVHPLSSGFMFLFLLAVAALVYRSADKLKLDLPVVVGHTAIVTLCSLLIWTMFYGSFLIFPGAHFDMKSPMPKLGNFQL